MRKQPNNNTNFSISLHQRIMMITSIFVIITVIICSFLFASVNTQAAPTELSYKYYTSIQIQDGDTLSGIASTYITDDYSSLDSYMDEICSMNHISKDTIHAGQYITIPYYSTVSMN